MMAALLAGAVRAEAQTGNWLTDYNAAVAQAQSSQKSVLLDFTGSDWCPWCIRMDREVLDAQAFQDYADKNLVLVMVDFPRRKQLPDDVAAQNAKLKEQFGIRGFPSFVLIDKDGKEIWRHVGYMQGGPEAFIAALGGTGQTGQ
jgi:thioredoxin-related protein